MTIQDMTGEQGVSRRKALKAMGVGAAAAWAVPTVVSMASVAAAASGTCVTFVCGNGPCNTDCPNATGDNSAYCFQRADGLPGICAPDFACANAGCTDNSDCGAGEACFVNTCCGAGGVCGPIDCGVPPLATPLATRSGKTAGGRVIG
jgi:hypothetical protein